ncbi:hypothetical protein VTO42DRAFT_2235 [Malbranchea cinnamomea]
MDDVEIESWCDSTECYVGPFGRLLPVATVRPEWLCDPPRPDNPQPRSRYEQCRPVEKPTALRFGSDTSLLEKRQQYENSTPSPPRSVTHSEPDENRERRELSHLSTPTSYPATISTCSTFSSRTASPVEACYTRGRQFPNEMTDPWTLRSDVPLFPTDSSGSVPMGMYMSAAGNEAAQFSPGNVDLASIGSTKMNGLPTETVEQPPMRYHQSRLPYIPDLAPSDSPINERSPVDSTPVCDPAQRRLVYVVEERVIEGKGLCYIYSDGSHCPKYLNGELVNANWGITKAGKPRKRLAQACLTCRAKKIKCTPNFPKCEQCQRSGRNCRYENAVRRNSKSADRSATSEPPEKIRLLNAPDLPSLYTAVAETVYANMPSPTSSQTIPVPVSRVS